MDSNTAFVIVFLAFLAFMGWAIYCVTQSEPEDPLAKMKRQFRREHSKPWYPLETLGRDKPASEREK